MKTEFTVRGEYIELIKLLKAVGAAPTGGAAKIMVDQEIVSVNGVPETRKRRKIRAGDTVTCGEITISIQ